MTSSTVSGSVEAPTTTRAALRGRTGLMDRGRGDILNVLAYRRRRCRRAQDRKFGRMTLERMLEIGNLGFQARKPTRMFRGASTGAA